MQHVLHSGYHCIQIEDNRIDSLFATEQEKLPGQPGSALAGVLYLLGILGGWTFRSGLPCDQITIPQYDGQNVVEIMRNSAGELAYDLHFLCLNKLLLQFLPFVGALLDLRVEQSYFLLRLSPLRDVTNIALDHLSVSRQVNVAHELHGNLTSIMCFQRKIVVAHITMLKKLDELGLV